MGSQGSGGCKGLGSDLAGLCPPRQEFRSCFRSRGRLLEGFDQGRGCHFAPAAEEDKTGGRDTAGSVGAVSSRGRVLSGLRWWQSRRRGELQSGGEGEGWAGDPSPPLSVGGGALSEKT